MGSFLKYWLWVAARSLRDSWTLLIPHNLLEIIRTMMLGTSPFIVAYFVGPTLVRERVMSADNVQDTVIWMGMGLAGLVAIWAALFFSHFLFITPFRLWREAISSNSNQAQLTSRPHQDCGNDWAKGVSELSIRDAGCAYASVNPSNFEVSAKAQTIAKQILWDFQMGYLPLASDLVSDLPRTHVVPADKYPRRVSATLDDIVPVYSLNRRYDDRRWDKSWITD